MYGHAVFGEADKKKVGRRPRPDLWTETEKTRHMSSRDRPHQRGRASRDKHHHNRPSYDNPRKRWSSATRAMRRSGEAREAALPAEAAMSRGKLKLAIRRGAMRGAGNPEKGLALCPMDSLGGTMRASGDSGPEHQCRPPRWREARRPGRAEDAEVVA